MDKEGKSIFEACFESEPAKVKDTVKNVINFVKNSMPSISEEDLLELRIILSELLYNAVVHGNNSNVDKFVKLFIEIKDSIVHAVISDEGTGFDYNGILNASDYEEYKDHGRGIKIVYSLADIMYFNDKGNEIKIFKRMNKIG